MDMVIEHQINEQNNRHWNWIAFDNDFIKKDIDIDIKECSES